jgi:hypothetical protein
MNGKPGSAEVGQPASAEAWEMSVRILHSHAKIHLVNRSTSSNYLLEAARRKMRVPSQVRAASFSPPFVITG